MPPIKRGARFFSLSEYGPVGDSVSHKQNEIEASVCDFKSRSRSPGSQEVSCPVLRTPASPGGGPHGQGWGVLASGLGSRSPPPVGPPGDSSVRETLSQSHRTTPPEFLTIRHGETITVGGCFEVFGGRCYTAGDNEYRGLGGRFWDQLLSWSPAHDDDSLTPKNRAR